jgi:uncharacterized radical SAM superfamily Fe-S cluster-containing enzyme
MIRLLGGEPTLNPNLFEIIDIAKKNHHQISLISNGIKYADYEFCKELKKHGPITPSISLDAEYSSTVKLQALDNLSKLGFKRITLSATLVHGNEDIIYTFRDLKERFDGIRYMHFRSEMLKGSYTLKEMEDMVSEVFNWENPHKIVRDGKAIKKCCGQCKIKQVSSGLQILIMDCHRSSNKCWLRGYIDNDAMEINGFFKTLRDRQKMFI